MMRRLCVILLAFALPISSWALPSVQQLDTDVPAWLIEDHTVPVVSISLTFKGAGSAYDPQDKQGLARLVASLLQEGASGMSAAAFQAYLNRHAIQLSPGASRDDFSVSFYGLREHAGEGMRAVAKLLLEPNLEQAALDRVRAQHLASLAIMKQDPGYHASRKLSEHLYGDHPYGYNRQGTEETLAAISLEDVHAYLAQMVQQEKLSVAAAGAMRVQELEGWLEPLLERIPSDAIAVQTLGAVPAISRVAQESELLDNPQSAVRFAAPGIARDDPDFFAAFVLTHILGGNGLTSLLAEELRQKRGLTYGVYSWLDNGDAVATLQGSFATATATRTEAVDALSSVLDSVYANGVTQDLRDQAVNYITGAFPLALDSARGLANYVHVMQRYDLGADYIMKRNSLFEAVTLEDVNRVAKRLLDPKTRLVVWAGQESAPAPSATQEVVDE